MEFDLKQASRIADMGISGDLQPWLALNLAALDDPRLAELLPPFPPAELMQVTTGLTEPRPFVLHGTHFAEVLAAASPMPLGDFSSILDFGCGVGRLARMFKGLKGKYTGVDIDGRLVEWIGKGLDYVDAHLSTPRQPLPFADGSFDCVVSLSVFTHMNEEDQDFYLKELKRVTAPGATLLLTVHGPRALGRALTEKFIFNLVWCPRNALEKAAETLAGGAAFQFIRQEGHLSTDEYDYGITFMNHEYLAEHWARYFSLIDLRQGAIHDFQDIVVLRRE